NAGCLGKTFIGIHCNSVLPHDWTRWPKADAGAVVWSPFSNLWLYGSTTDVKAAQQQGVSVCIGSDWGPSGTKNIQGEIKVAKLVSQKQGLGLSDRTGRDDHQQSGRCAGPMLEEADWSPGEGGLC